MSIIKKKNTNNKYIIIVAIVAIAMIATLCVIISLIIPKQNKKENKSENSQTASSNNTPQTTDSTGDEIKSLSESNRMKRYIGIFFDNIDQGNYQEAYNKLNEDYKSNYFSTLQEFTEYAKENFKTNMLGVTYDNIERLANNKTGNMYVVKVTVADMVKGKIETDFVIIEKDYNDYEMSFSANLKD